MEFVVFGAGSLGSLIGGLLARVHDVTLVGRRPHVERVREDGLRIEGRVTATVRPDARTAPVDADCALVTVKAFDTPAAAGALAGHDYDCVLSLQNGVGNEERLAERLEPPVLAGTCTYGARLRGPGRVECTGAGEVALGAREGGPSTLARRVGRAFDAADVAAVVAEDMPRRLWEKLAVNAAVNAPTALARVENGALEWDPGREVAASAAREAARVAPRETGIDPEGAVAAAERVVATTADNRSSMLQDVERGRRTEVDYLNGAVVDAGDERGVATPVNATLAGLVRAWERGRDLR
jgi:2-dehydropantoate 2-reductase